MRRIRWILLLCLIVAAFTAYAEEDPVTRLFDKNYDFWDCDWSPDGKCLALAGKYHNQPATRARIWLYKLGAEKPIPWTNTTTLCDDWPRWSPDGKNLVMVRKELATRRTCLWLKDVVTGRGSRLTNGSDDGQPSWSPDGKAIVFRRRTGLRQTTLAVLDLATKAVSTLPINPGQLGEAFWGQDGAIYYTRYQLYAIQGISGGRLWRFEPGTGHDVRVTAAECDQRMPSLSPDGRWLAFYGQRSGSDPAPPIPDPDRWALFMRDQANGQVKEIVANVALTGGPPAWSRDSRAVTYFSLRMRSPALWTYALADPEAPANE